MLPIPAQRVSEFDIELPNDGSIEYIESASRANGILICGDIARTPLYCGVYAIDGNTKRIQSLFTEDKLSAKIDLYFAADTGSLYVRAKGGRIRLLGKYITIYVG